jgi:predicted dehydrogenase
MKIAIIGCGLIGSKRAESLPEHVSLVGCYDAKSEVCENFALKYQTRAFETLEKIFEIQNLDAVAISTQHDSLAKISIEALNRGLHVFVEKPGAIKPEDLIRMQEIAIAKNLILHIGYNHQYHPAIQKTHSLISNQEIGELMFIRARYGHGGRIGYEKEWRADKTKSGGGELIDQGTHLLEIAISLLGELKLDYCATPTYFWNMNVEDNVFISVKNNTGAIAFLHASCTEWKNTFSLEVYGKKGKIDVNGLGRSYGVETLTLHKMLPEMGPPVTTTWIFDEPDTSWSLELVEFFNDVKNDTNNANNLAPALNVLELVSEIYERTRK